MQKTKDLDKKLLITVHDYFLWCKNFFLLSPLKGSLPSFCCFEQDETICAECLKKSNDVRQLIYGRAWSDEHDSEEYVRQRRSNISHLLGTADSIVSPTEFVRNSFLNGYPNIDPSRFIVLEHGMLKLANTARVNHHEGAGKLKIAFLGGFKYEKGSVYFSELIKCMSDTTIDFYVIGNISNPMASHALSSIKTTGQYKREELHGILAKEGIDLIVLLSPWAETFSYTLSEAIINNIPVIATDTGAFRERIAKHGVGFLVPYENPVPRASRIIRDIADNPKILEFFIQNCKDAAQSLRDVDTMVSEYVELYRKIIA
jgi:glycosyltransferase involved in cell wall biosynthesis